MPRRNQEAASDLLEACSLDQIFMKLKESFELKFFHALLRFDVPEDGLPSIDDWLTTFHSILLDGLELQREPLDVSVWYSVSL